jgi:carboxypeptidase T
MKLKNEFLLKNAFFLIIIILSFVSVNIFASEDSNPIFDKKWSILGTVKTTDFQKTFKELRKMDIDISGVDISNKLIDILITDFDFKNLERAGYDVDIMQTKGISKGPDPEYKNPSEIEFLVQEFADKYPLITKRISIGKSLEGRDIWAIKISDNADNDEISEPSILFNSMHHAREVMSPEASLDIIETLLTGYNIDSDITKWVDAYEIWVIPMFNVDGNNKMWNYDKWWRKNNRGGFGVDLNRNYPTAWNKCNGSSGSQSSQTYRGPNPASEPETQAMMNFVAKVRPVFDISYHSYSELVIYPLGCSPERTATKDIVEKIGKEVAKVLNYEPGTAWELLYNADGGDIDWMYDAYQVIPFVIELNARSQGFHPNYKKWRDKTVQRNRAGWQHLLKRLEGSGIRGQLTINNIAANAYQIDIYKLNGKKSFYQTYVGHKTGMYHLVLNPGRYELEFKVNNKVIKKVKHNVVLTLGQLDVSVNL